MFVKEIYDLTLINDVANTLYGNISAHGYCNDNTFTATLRAVLHNRLPAGEILRLSLVSIDQSVTDPEWIASNIRQQDKGGDYKIFIVFSWDKSCGGRLLESVRANFGEGKRHYGSLTLQEDLRIFYIKTVNGLFYTNGFTTLIFLDYMDVRRFHAPVCRAGGNHFNKRKTLPVNLIAERFRYGFFSGAHVSDIVQRHAFDIIRAFERGQHFAYLNGIARVAHIPAVGRGLRLLLG